MEQYWVSYRNQSFVLQGKTNDWFLYEMQHCCTILESIEPNMNIQHILIRNYNYNHYMWKPQILMIIVIITH